MKCKLWLNKSDSCTEGAYDLTVHIILPLLLTSWSRILLEKVTGSQLVKNSPHLMESKGSLPHLQPPPFPVLSQIKTVHALPSPFLKIHLHIILPSIPGSSKWSLSLKFPHQRNPVYTSLPHMCYMLRPFHSSCYHPNNIWWAVLIIRLLIM